jgi:hypothetical protein
LLAWSNDRSPDHAPTPRVQPAVDRSTPAVSDYQPAEGLEWAIAGPSELVALLLQDFNGNE